VETENATRRRGASYEIIPGDTVDDFFVQNVLARSGMGTLFKARQRSTGRAVVLKVPHLHFECDVAFYSRFQREEQIGIRLRHPTIAETIPVPKKSRFYLAMEHVEGRSLREMLGDGRMPAERAFALGQQVCEALAYMHAQGVVHRDLKPDNLLLTDDGTVRIIDFGIALDAAARRLTWGKLSTRLGTPEYMAPERLRGRRGDGRTDVYSLGIVLYELIAGTTPYAVEDVSVTGTIQRPSRPLGEVAPDVDPSVDAVLARAIALDPDDRYPSVTDMLSALRDPSSAVASFPVARPSTRARDAACRKAAWAAFAVALFGLLWLVVRTH
jgi:serine/threonine-protein kinase